MLRQLGHGLLDLLPQVPLSEQVIRRVGAVFPLQGSVVRFPVLLDRLEQNQRIARPVAQLVLRQVARDRVDPRRELLGRIEPVQVTVHAYECLLDQVFGAIAVSDRAVDEVQQTGVIALSELVEGVPPAVQVLRYQRRVIQLLEVRPQRPLIDARFGTFEPSGLCRVQHFVLPRSPASPPASDRSIGAGPGGTLQVTPLSLVFYDSPGAVTTGTDLFPCPSDTCRSAIVAPRPPKGRSSTPQGGRNRCHQQ